MLLDVPFAFLPSFFCFSLLSISFLRNSSNISLLWDRYLIKLSSWVRTKSSTLISALPPSSYIEDQCLHMDDELHTLLGAFNSFSSFSVNFKISQPYRNIATAGKFIAKSIILTLSFEVIIWNHYSLSSPMVLFLCLSFHITEFNFICLNYFQIFITRFRLNFLLYFTTWLVYTFCPEKLPRLITIVSHFKSPKSISIPFEKIHIDWTRFSSSTSLFVNNFKSYQIEVVQFLHYFLPNHTPSLSFIIYHSRG